MINEESRIKIYVRMIKNPKRNYSLNDVPERYRERVKQALQNGQG